MDGLVLCLYNGPLMFTDFITSFPFTKWVQEVEMVTTKRVSLKTIDCRHRPNFMQFSRAYQKSSLLKEHVILKNIEVHRILL